ncbi:MAG: LCP family protein [Vampirovibrionia bacterium]
MQTTRLTKKKNNGFSLRWWISTITISFGISLILIWIIHTLWHPAIGEFAQNIPGNINIFNKGLSSPSLPKIKKKMLVLAMGVDSNGFGTDPFKGTRTDTMIVAALDPEKNTVNAISIPRDSKVYLADNKGVDKINAAHAYGGPELTVKTVNQTLGINVDHYILINYAGMKELVKALGGVEVYVEKRMKYTDRTAKLFIDLQPGRQLLDADQAEMYLRFRHDAEGDIGRIKRQQWFMKGVIDKLKDPSIIFKMPQLIELSKKYVQTDMDVPTMMQIGGFVKDLDLNKIQIATLPGTPSQYSRISYWLIDVNNSQILIDKLIHGFEDVDTKSNSDEPITISILYNKEAENDIDEITTKFESANYKVVCKNTTKEVHTKIISHSNKATVDTTNQLRYDIEEIKKAPIFLSPKEVYCANSDYTIVLGKDN